MSIRRASSVTFVSHVVTVVVTVRCRQFVVSSSSCLTPVGCRKREVRNCQDPRCNALFQRPYVSTLIRISFRSVSIRSSRRVRIDIPHRPPIPHTHIFKTGTLPLCSYSYTYASHCAAAHLSSHRYGKWIFLREPPQWHCIYFRGAISGSDAYIRLFCSKMATVTEMWEASFTAVRTSRVFPVLCLQYVLIQNSESMPSHLKPCCHSTFAEENGLMQP